jgi:uncharacterized protein
MDQLVTRIEGIVQDRLGNWPAQWEGFHWPGYTHEHTLRVRNLALRMGEVEGADPQIVELAALLHDIEKQAGRTHAAAGAETAQGILAELTVDAALTDAVCHAIATHTGDNTPDHAVENRVLGDADLMDANFGLVATWRFITIRAGHGTALDETIVSMAEWLPKKDELAALLLTDSGRAITEARRVRMHEFCEAMLADFQRTQRNGEFGLLELAQFIAADFEVPNLSRQMVELQGIMAEKPTDAFVRAAVAALGEEIEGRL